MQKIRIICRNCSHINKVPLRRFYDGFDGFFTCKQCNDILEGVNDAFDEGED